MLELAKIFKSYGSARVLDGASLRCERGQAVCLAGANAAGKTTLLTIAAGVQKADRGEVRCDGTVGYVPQETALLADLSVRDNLALWYAACSRPRSAMFSADSPERALGLCAFAGRRVSRLSGGVKKRAAIACALAARPDYLIMDEPFTALDVTGRADIAALLRGLKQRGAGLLFSSHDPSAIASVADVMVLLRGGRVDAPAALTGDEACRMVQAAEQLSRA